MRETPIPHPDLLALTFNYGSNCGFCVSIYSVLRTHLTRIIQVAMKRAASAFLAPTKEEGDSASTGADTKQTNAKATKASKAKELAKAVNRAKAMHSAIPMWLTENLGYFQNFHGQLHAAENQILDVSAPFFVPR